VSVTAHERGGAICWPISLPERLGFAQAGQPAAA